MKTPNDEDVKAKTLNLLRTKFFHPHRTNADFEASFQSIFESWTDWSAANTLEQRLDSSLRNLGASHTGFWRGAGRGLQPYYGINATLRRTEEEVLAFWDVLAGGLSQRAGVKPGDDLLEIDSKPILEEPRFELGRTYKLKVRRLKQTLDLEIALPGRGPKFRPPMAEVTPLTYRVSKKAGILKATAFPGVIGFDFIKELSNALNAFEEEGCDRLILDLRNNCGGGLASLRLMSLLTPESKFVGYTMTRKSRDAGKTHEALPAIDRLPSTKIAAIPMGLRFRFLHRDRSLRLFTEGLGAQPFQNRVSILVNEYTRSAAEMIAAFAQQERLAHVIGTNTPGEVLGAANFNVGLGYTLRIPITGWFTPQNDLIEGRGVTPDKISAHTLGDLRDGRDLPMEEALAYVNSL